MSVSLFPLFADLRDRPVLVVGGGAIAARKIERLLAAGARVRVGAPELVEELQDLVASKRVFHRGGMFQPTWVDGVWLVVAATADKDINRAVAQAALDRQVLVNVVDDAELSSFHMPAVVERGPLQVAISSGGGAPMLARRLREQLETLLDESIGALAELFARQRERIRSRLPQIRRTPALVRSRPRWLGAGPAAPRPQ